MSSNSVRTFSIGTVGVDKTGAVITTAVATNLVGLGYKFALRDIGVYGNASSQGGQLGATELTNLLNAGLSVSVFQINFKQTVFSATTGKQDADYLVEQLVKMAFPQTNTFTVWFDLEGSMGGNRTNLLNYVNAWSSEIVANKFAAGMYTGSNSPLSGSDISGLANFHAYWQAGQWLDYAMPARGYQMYQLYPAAQNIGGTLVDVDVVQHDFQGGITPFWGASAQSAA